MATRWLEWGLEQAAQIGTARGSFGLPWGNTRQSWWDSTWFQTNLYSFSATQFWFSGYQRPRHHCPQLLRRYRDGTLGTDTDVRSSLQGYRMGDWPWGYSCCSTTFAPHHHADDDPEDIAQLIRDYDPQGTKLVLMVSAPPCPDFSPIKGDDAPGSSGQEGQKFMKFCNFARSVEERLPDKNFGYLVENVILQDKAEADLFAKTMDCNVIAVDAADYGLINRPRLWWSRIAWSRIKQHPFTGHPLRWSKMHGFPRLHIDEPMQEESQLDLGGYRLHRTVSDHTHRVPCLTTPAPTDAGRSAPKKLKGRIHPETKSRWLRDQRRFAPWQYSAEALLHGSNGEMVVPGPEIKEQLHQLPCGYTAVDGVSDRARHRLLANGWHAGVARLMLFLVVVQLCQHAKAGIPPQPKMSTIKWILQELAGSPGHIGPGNWSSSPSCMPPASSMWEHWHLSADAIHPLLQEAQLDPGMKQALSFQQRWRHCLAELRQTAVDEIETLVEAHADDTQRWWNSLPPHIQQVYYNPDFEQVTQIPLFLDLLEMFGFPDLPNLREDLQQGFAMTGELHPGSGWNPRTDEKYSWPIDQDSFVKMNHHYTHSKLLQGRPDPFWTVMLDELYEERRLGRLSGPFVQPSWWPCMSVGFEGEDLLPLPQDQITVSFCFSVQQQDKVRRCEDFRRSGHNATVAVNDSPPHDDVDKFIQLAKAYSSLGFCSEVWSQDLSGAYRQFPVRNPDDCYCAILTEKGPMLFKHHALSFGAVASVWSFNRCADALTFLSRRLLAVTVGHYVDDFIGVEEEHTVMSGFEQFTRLFRLLGLRMKEKKALAPSPSHKILGVQMTLAQHQAVLAPHPDRISKMQNLLKECLRSNQMTSEMAHSISGKLTFLCSTMFGQLGKAAMKPIYGRSHGLQVEGHSDQLNTPLRQGLSTLLSILAHLQPRLIPFGTTGRTTCLYTDAYFQRRPVHVPSRWDSSGLVSLQGTSAPKRLGFRLSPAWPHGLRLWSSAQLCVGEVLLATCLHIFLGNLRAIFLAGASTEQAVTFGGGFYRQQSGPRCSRQRLRPWPLYQ